MRKLLVLLSALALSGLCPGQTVTFAARLHRHQSAQNRVLVGRLGELTFADHVLAFQGDGHEKLEIPYTSVSKVVFDTTTHMRGVTPGSVAAEFVPAVGFIAGPVARAHHVQNYWFYLEYKDGDHDQDTLLEVGRDSFQKVIEKASSVFAAKVVVANYPEKGAEIELSKLPDLNSKDAMRVDKVNHPTPELKPGQALLVVVCPPLRTREAGRGNQFKLHANDRVIAVNKPGTYSFAYLDPGKYRLVSQSENAYGFEMDLEGGKAYYFLQNTFQGVFKASTSLSRNSPELVNYLADGSYYSDWKPK
jgi:hypothetical protein